MNTHMDKQWDAVIIGGGAAGLTAGIILARARFATLIVDGGSPRNAPAEHMHGFLSRDGMAPTAFLETGRAELVGYGGTVTRATVADAVRAGDGTFNLVLEPGATISARAVLVATGLSDELPDIPGLRDHWATDVHSCPHCHGYEVRGRSIAVLGSAMRAGSVHFAGLMRRYSEDVSFVRNGVTLVDAERARLTGYGVRLVDGDAKRVVSKDGRVSGIELDGGELVGCDTIFVAPTPRPHDVVLTTLGCAQDPETGFTAVDPGGATDIPGVWAAGNVVNPRAQVVTAAGAASAAAIAITGWLLDKELTQAAEGDVR
ncbi:MAG: NAD(P)/FAD-dependent oxidoreductase [Stackebrandtia sp.]